MILLEDLHRFTGRPRQDSRENIRMKGSDMKGHAIQAETGIVQMASERCDQRGVIELARPGAAQPGGDVAGGHCGIDGAERLHHIRRCLAGIQSRLHCLLLFVAPPVGVSWGWLGLYSIVRGHLNARRRL